jgi:hypothetical protein
MKLWIGLLPLVEDSYFCVTDFGIDIPLILKLFAPRPCLHFLVQAGKKEFLNFCSLGRDLFLRTDAFELQDRKIDLRYLFTNSLKERFSFLALNAQVLLHIWVLFHTIS